MDVDVDIPKLSKDRSKRIKHSKRHTNADIDLPQVDVATARRRVVGQKISVMN